MVTHNTFLLLSLVSCLLQTLVESLPYRAAVATLAGFNNSNGRTQLQHFEHLALKAKASGAQIIAFPEAALWNPGTRQQMFVQANGVAKDGTVPCEATPTSIDFPQVATLSCIARKSGVVIVANVLSRIYCSTDTPCPLDGVYLYNSDVIFDERGTVLKTYFKRHDYLPLDQPPLVPVSFNTSFGVEFGVFVCYDIAFASPVEQLVKRGVRNFILSQNWVNEVPLQTATTSQQGLSRFFGANLIASNIANNAGNGGSGIYAAGDPVVVAYNASGSWPLPETLLMADLDSVPPFPPVVGNMADSLGTASVGSDVAGIEGHEVAAHVHTVPCTISAAADARSGKCTMLPRNAGPGKVRLEASHTDKATGAIVKCRAAVKLLERHHRGRYALFASAWRNSSKLDVCALLPCDMDQHGNCPPSYNGTLLADEATITMTTLAGAKTKVLLPLVARGEVVVLPRSYTDLRVCFNGSSVLTTKSGIANVGPLAPLYMAALYGVDAIAPNDVTPNTTQLLV